MEVILAKTAGFCFGVERAVDTVYREIGKKEQPIYTYGPIIHNEEVVRDLNEKGVVVIDDLCELSQKEKGIVIIRSHGVSEAELLKMEESPHQIVDATCPFVKKIHTAVRKYSGEGREIVIIGDPTHPEVMGICGWCLKPAAIIKTTEEAEGLTIESKKICIVAQTTFQITKFDEIVEIIQKKGYDSIVLNTICNATEERQREAEEIAGRVDAMIVIGGKKSSNTAKLYSICKARCGRVQYIQTKNDLDVELLKDCQRVGITAGASTPKNLIEEVQNYVRTKF